MKLIKHNVKLSLDSKSKTTIELPSMGGAGYQWKLSKSDQDIVEVDISAGITEEEAKKKPPGASGTTKVTLTASKKGKASINLLQTRPWEGDDGAAEKCEIDVEVT